MSIHCPSCSAFVNDGEPFCDHCGWDLSRVSQLCAIPTPLTKPKIPVIAEIGITIDRTGSSKRFAAGIKRTVPAILQGVARKAAEVRVWVQSHGDLDFDEQHCLHTDAGTVDQATLDVDSIVFEGGGDPPETHLDAIQNLASIVPWTADRTRARGVLLAFMTDESKRSRSGHTPYQIGRQLHQSGLLTYLVCEPRPQLIALADASQAMTVPITNNPSQAMLDDMVNAISASIVQTLATGGTVPI